MFYTIGQMFISRWDEQVVVYLKMESLKCFYNWSIEPLILVKVEATCPNTVGLFYLKNWPEINILKLGLVTRKTGDSIIPLRMSNRWIR